jgi:hypothetical protein
MLECEGIVELHLKDAATGELIEKRVQHNRLTWLALMGYITRAEGFGPYIGISNDTNVTRVDDILFKVSAVTMTEIGYVSSGVTSPLYTGPVGATPANVLFTNRFDQPSAGVTRNISSIFLTSVTPSILSNWKSSGYYEGVSIGNNGVFYYPSDSTYSRFEGVHARIKLDTPCTQTDTQVLDIYYRVKISIPSPNETGITDSFLAYVVKKLARYSSPHLDYVMTTWNANYPPSGQSLPGLKFNNSFFIYDANNEQTNTNYGYTIWDGISGYTPFSVSRDFRLFKHKFNYSMSLADNIGRILGTMTYGSNWDGSTACWAPVLPINSPASRKIQPVHNHASAGTLPFIDINNLAVGQGTIVPDGTGWVNKDYPEMYRVQICTSGEPGGAASYTLMKRNHLGFANNTYQNRCETVPWMVSRPNRVFEYNHGTVEPMTTITTGGYGADLACGYNAEKYDYTSIVTSDKTGVQWTSVVKPQSYAWNSSTVPALPVTYIQQFAVTAPKIWVGCRNTGLYVIDKDANTVTKMNIPGVLSKCYGVDIGYNGSIWAVMDGGIVGSTDDGLNWTVYNALSSPAFSFTGISNSNWNTVVYIRVDPSKSTNQMLLVRDKNTAILPTNGLVWWSTATAATAGYTGTDAQWLRQTKFLCNVSDNGWWLGGFENGNNDINRTRVKQMAFNSSTITDTGAEFWNYGYQYNIMFDILPTGEEVFLLPYRSSGTFNWGSTYTEYYRAFRVVRRTDLAHFNTVYNFSGANEHVALPFMYARSVYYAYRPIYLGKGLMTFSAAVNQNTSTQSYPAAQSIMIDVLNNQPMGGVYGKMIWEEYRWNGTNWVKDYHTPLEDSSGNNKHGVRKFFWPNSRQFQGQYNTGDGYSSHVTCDDVFGSNFSAGKITLTATVTTTASAIWNTLFEVANISNTAANPIPRLSFMWNSDTTNTLGIYNTPSGSTQNFGTHSTDGLQHRLVFTISGTTAKCYIDGAQVGTSKTLTTVPSLTNAILTIGGQRTVWPLKPDGSFSATVDMFNASITNIQVWNADWTAVDVAYDYANQAGLISDQVGSPITTANLMAWYKNTGPLSETKPCHTTSEPIIEGLSLSFTPGSIGTSFIAGDYYTFGAVNGVWKDNATTYSGSYSIYGTPSIKNCVDIENSGVIQIIPAKANVLVTDWNSQGITPTPDINLSTGKVTFYGKETGVVSSQVLYGDFEVTFTGIQTTGIPADFEFEFGVGSIGNSEFRSFQSKDFFYRLFQNLTGQFGTNHRETVNNGYAGYYDIMSDPFGTGVGNGTIYGYAVTAGTRLSTDVFKFKRVGDTITLYLNATLVHTAQYVRQKGFVVKMRARNLTSSSSFLSPSCTIVTASASPPIALLGNIVNKTGIFDPAFLNIDIDSSVSAIRNIQINGTNIAGKWTSWDWAPLATLPAINEVTISSNGIVVCNAADIGKTLTATYNYLKWPV